ALLNSDTFKNMPYSSVFADDLERGHIVYYGANSTAIQSALGTAVQSVMLQNVSPEDAYNTLKKTVQELIEQ
ncbi:MAG: ABC transporter substrate-binding protein, partial [Treponema sp.]